LAQQNVEVLNSVFEGREPGKRKIVTTCAHCFNSIANEYSQLGGNYDVVHHTQLLNRLGREKRLVPVAPVAQDVTYHDPCYLGRHNKVYTPPRELVGASGADLREVPRHDVLSMCCGAGATWVGTTRCTRRRASWSALPAPTSGRCRGTPTGRCAAVPVVPGCGWKSASASASTWSASTRRSAPRRRRSRPAARSAA